MKFFEFTKEGLPIDTGILHDNRRISAMCATVLSVSERYVKEYACGNLKRILIHAGNEILVLSKEGENGLLSIIKKNYDLGQGYLKDIEK